MTEQAQQLELNDDRLINITLTNSQWNMVTDWFSRIPFDQAHDILMIKLKRLQKMNQTTISSLLQV